MTNLNDLLEAVEEGNIQRVRDILRKKTPSVDLNCRNEIEDTPLIIAARNGDSGLVQLLSEEGADLYAVNTDGDNALTAAALYPGNVTVLNQLLHAGLNINSRNKMGRTALIIAASIGAIRNVAFLLKHEPEIDAVTVEEETALTFAVVWDYPEVVKTLIEAGVNVHWKDSHGWTALNYALQHGNEEIIQLVRNARAKDRGPLSTLENNQEA